MTVKGDTNRRWTSTDKYRDNYDKIFNKVAQTPVVVCCICGAQHNIEYEDFATDLKCPICGQALFSENT